MNWGTLAEQLSKGEALWRSFKDGAEAAALLSNLERAKAELQIQYDALPPQIDQAKTELATVQAQVIEARMAAATQTAAQQRDFEAAHQTRVTEAKAELAGWKAKFTEQAEQYDAEHEMAQAESSRLQAAVEQLKVQIASLEKIKTALKAQLQGVG